MDARAVLSALRRGEAPGTDAAAWFGRAIGTGEVSDAQVGAFAMGVCRAPMPAEARAALTLAMRDSGDVLAWDLPGPVLDKHSTGGIGDCVSLVLAPALAACGAFVPMISGRGLGHTGGTLDKLEAIPGVRTAITGDALRRIVAGTGAAIVGAGPGIAPADRRLYAVRDVTGTVESLDLITASILSKKLAAGLEGLVLDVKVGSGAFMERAEEAEALARSLVDTARAAGCPTTALITDMDQPLAPAAGNALEVAVAMAALTGAGPAPLLRVTGALGGALLALGGLAADAAEGERRIAEALASGRAAERFGRMVAAQGGPADFPDRWWAHLPAAPVRHAVPAPAPGVVAAIDGRALGLAVIALGGGRRREDDRVDPAVGLGDLPRIGEQVGPDRPLATVHAATEAAAAEAEAAVTRAITLSAGPVEAPPLIRARPA